MAYECDTCRVVYQLGETQRRHIVWWFVLFTEEAEMYVKTINLMVIVDIHSFFYTL